MSMCVELGIIVTRKHKFFSCAWIPPEGNENPRKTKQNNWVQEDIGLKVLEDSPTVKNTGVAGDPSSGSLPLHIREQLSITLL